jgi:hypothetical protein
MAKKKATKPPVKLKAVKRKVNKTQVAKPEESVESASDLFSGSRMTLVYLEGTLVALSTRAVLTRGLEAGKTETDEWRSTLQVGDWIDASGSDDLYPTPFGLRRRYDRTLAVHNKLYKVVEVCEVEADGRLTGKTQIDMGVEAEDGSRVLLEINPWYASRVIVRNGEIIWKSTCQRALEDKETIRKEAEECLRPELVEPVLSVLDLIRYEPNVASTLEK